MLIAVNPYYFLRYIRFALYILPKGGNCELQQFPILLNGYFQGFKYALHLADRYFYAQQRVNPRGINAERTSLFKRHAYVNGPLYYLSCIKLLNQIYRAVNRILHVIYIYALFIARAGLCAYTQRPRCTPHAVPFKFSAFKKYLVSIRLNLAVKAAHYAG